MHRQVAGEGQRHADDSTLTGCVCHLANLAVVSSHAGCVHHHPSLAVCVRCVTADQPDSQSDDVERADGVHLQEPANNCAYGCDTYERGTNMSNQAMLNDNNNNNNHIHHNLLAVLPTPQNSTVLRKEFTEKMSFHRKHSFVFFQPLF